MASGLKEPVHLYFVRLGVSEPDDTAVLAEELRAQGARVEQSADELFALCPLPAEEAEPFEAKALWLLERIAASPRGRFTVLQERVVSVEEVLAASLMSASALSRMFVLPADEVLRNPVAAAELRRNRPETIVVATDAEPRGDTLARILAGADACICGSLGPDEMGAALDAIDRFYWAAPPAPAAP